MDLKTRKIEFVQEFLKLHDEEAVSRFEKLLEKEKEKNLSEDLVPMTEEELNDRIDQSEADFDNKRYKNSSDLLSRFK